MSPFSSGKMVDGVTLPRPAERWFRRGLELCRAGRHREALEPLERAMALVAGDPTVGFGRLLKSCYGLTLVMVRHDVDAGRRLCEDAVADGPLDAELYMNLALVYVRSHRRRLAVEALTTVLSINPENAAAKGQLERLGRRRRPVFPFLSRRHPLNKVAGKWRHQWLVKRGDEPR